MSNHYAILDATEELRPLIRVVATVEFVYELDENIENKDAAIEDVRSMLANGEITSAEFTITAGLA